jgi:hypothetical protein
MGMGGVEQGGGRTWTSARLWFFVLDQRSDRRSMTARRDLIKAGRGSLIWPALRGFPGKFRQLRTDNPPGHPSQRH